MIEVLSAGASILLSLAVVASRQSGNVDFDVIYSGHGDASDFALVVPAVDAAVLRATSRGRRIVVFVEQSVLGPLPHVGFAHEFPGWDAQRVVRDEVYRRDFAEYYDAYLFHQRSVLETIDWPATKARDPRTYLGALVSYLARRIVDEHATIELRQEEPPLQHLVERLKSKSVEPEPAVEEMRDRKFVEDVVAYARGVERDTTVIIFRGAYHRQVTEMLRHAGYEVRDCLGPSVADFFSRWQESREARVVRTLEALVLVVASSVALLIASLVGRAVYRRIHPPS